MKPVTTIIDAKNALRALNESLRSAASPVQEQDLGGSMTGNSDRLRMFVSKVSIAATGTEQKFRHGLSRTPRIVIPVMTQVGRVALTSPPDGTFVYVTISGGSYPQDLYLFALE